MSRASTESVTPSSVSPPMAITCGPLEHFWGEVVADAVVADVFALVAMLIDVMVVSVFGLVSDLVAVVAGVVLVGKVEVELGVDL